MAIDYFGIIYAALAGAGGSYSFMKTGRISSLATGIIFGCTSGVGAFIVSISTEDYHLSLGSSATLGTLMGYQYYNSKKIMPAGLLAGISLAMTLRYAALAFRNPNKEL